MKSDDPITNLISAFARLPGIGERTASRLAFYVLNEPDSLADDLSEALQAVKDQVNLCERCCNLTQSEICSICRAPDRDHSTIDMFGFVGGGVRYRFGHRASTAGVD